MLERFGSPICDPTCKAHLKPGRSQMATIDGSSAAGMHRSAGPPTLALAVHHHATLSRFAITRMRILLGRGEQLSHTCSMNWTLTASHREQVSVRKEMEKLAIQDVRVFRRRARDFLNYLRRRGRPCPGHGGLDEEDFDPDDSIGHADEIVIRLWHLTHAGPREHAVPWCSPWPQCRRQLSLLLARPQSQQSEQDDSSKTQRGKTNQSGGPLVLSLIHI